MSSASLPKRGVGGFAVFDSFVRPHPENLNFKGSLESVVMATHMEARQNADFAEKQSVGQAAGNTKHVAYGVQLPTRSPDMSTKEHIRTYLQTCPHLAVVTAPAEIFQRMLPQPINIHRLALKVSTSRASTNTLEIQTILAENVSQFRGPQNLCSHPALLIQVRELDGGN